jgi:hypothetical protein
MVVHMGGIMLAIYLAKMTSLFHIIFINKKLKEKVVLMFFSLHNTIY